MNRILSLLFVAMLSATSSFAQTKWNNPQEAPYPVVQNRAMPDAAREGFYHRLPAELKGKVRGGVWQNSKHAAGECIRFLSNASEITVRYTVKGGHAMAHMPATGVSGIDLYTSDKEGGEIWLAGRFAFRDTITYTFSGIEYEGDKREHRYTLFLPLYNEVEWLTIGTNEKASFRFEPLSAERPIVAYGTSICHGACASRPGMAWTNILQRRMGRNVVNLGFSGSAMLESAVIDILAEVDAKAYIIDAMPNAYTMSAEILPDTIVKAVKHLRAARPHTPIILADHLGYPNAKAIKSRRENERYALKMLTTAYKRLQSEGVENIHYLTYDDIALPQDATVEAIHASDYGMVTYANAYEKLLRTILGEEKGELRSTTPVTQFRDGYYNWYDRHRDIIEKNRGKHFDRIIIGNSIIHYWGGVEGNLQRGSDSWAGLSGETLNLGCGWDRTENVLWRIQHDELDNVTADKIILKIGTNNIQKSGGDSDKEIAMAIEKIIEAIAARRPEAEIIVMGVLPRRDLEKRVKGLNKEISRMAKRNKIKYLDPGKELLGKGGKIDESLFGDGLHPNAEGYRRIARYFE